MSNVRFSKNGTDVVIFLIDRIDTKNAAETEKEIYAFFDENKTESVVLDCDELNYISSAGLRIVLRLRKTFPNLELINVSSDVYEIFEMTGFTEMMPIQKAYRKISVEGCEVIGEGANGKVYRIDPETIVKAYRRADSLPEIKRERELARTAFVLGIPTAIPYDVVRIEGGAYGSVFELLNASSLQKLLIRQEKTLDEVVKISVDLLKQIHSTVVKPDSMPDMKAVALNWAAFLKSYLPEETFTKLYKLIEDVPDDHHMMHGDYHIKNVMVQNGEVLLIDMDTLCYGYPIFELASMFNAYGGYSWVDHENIKTFLGISFETAQEFWHKSLELYLGTTDPARIREVEEKAMLIGYTRIMRRCIRRNVGETEKGRELIEHAKSEIIRLTAKLDKLTF